MLLYYYLSLTVVIDLSLVILFVVRSIGDKGVLVIARKVLGQYSTVYGQQLDYEYPKNFKFTAKFPVRKWSEAYNKDSIVTAGRDGYNLPP